MSRFPLKIFLLGMFAALGIFSGGDTSLLGAVVSGKQIQGDIGGNLKIESRQDADYFRGRREQGGGAEFRQCEDRVLAPFF